MLSRSCNTSACRLSKVVTLYGWAIVRRVCLVGKKESRDVMLLRFLQM